MKENIDLELARTQGRRKIHKFIYEKELKMSTPKTIKIDEIEYVRKDSIAVQAINAEGCEYVIVRTYSAGVFAGYLKKRDGKESTLVNVRRIWKWSGAASLSQLAMEGTNDPHNCKFPVPVEKIIVTETIEILNCTEKSRISIQAVPIWKK